MLISTVFLSLITFSINLYINTTLSFTSLSFANTIYVAIFAQMSAFWTFKYFSNISFPITVFCWQIRIKKLWITLLNSSCFISYEKLIRHSLNFRTIDSTLNNLLINNLCSACDSNYNNLTSSRTLGWAYLALYPWIDKKLTKLTLLSWAMISAPSRTS